MLELFKVQTISDQSEVLTGQEIFEEATGGCKVTIVVEGLEDK